MFYGNHYANFFKKFVQPSGQFSQRRLFNIFPSAPFYHNLVTWCGLGLNSIHPRWFLGFHLASDVVHLFRSSGRKMVSFFFYFTGEPTSASLATCAITVPLLNGGQSNLFMEHTRLAANTENRATSLRFFFASSSRRYFPSDNYWIESRSVGSMMARDFRFQIKLQTSSGDRLAIAAVIGLFYVIFIFPLPHTQGTVTHLKQSRLLSYNLKFK